jgi:hypothetical protein
LRNVAEADAVYMPSEECHIAGTGQYPAVLGRCGNGWLGFVGDVNSEEDNRKVLLAKCGLKAPKNEPEEEREAKRVKT